MSWHEKNFIFEAQFSNTVALTPAWELSYVFIHAKSNQAGFDEVLRTNIQSNFYIMKSRLSVWYKKFV